MLFIFVGFEIDYEAETSDFTNECKEFMNKFVTRIFSGRWIQLVMICLAVKTKYSEFAIVHVCLSVPIYLFPPVNIAFILLC